MTRVGAIDNLNSASTRRQYARFRALETAPAATNTAIGRDGMEVYDGGEITIINGGLDVTGTATISGILNASGTINMTGDFTATGSVSLNGPTDIAGDLDVTGPTTISGTLSVEGVTTLKNDLNVTTGGKIKVGASMTLDPGVSSGAMVFSNGAQVFTDSTSIQVFNGNSVCQIEDGEARLQTGGNSVSVKGAGIFIPGLPAAPGGSTPNLYVDGVGKLFQII